MEISDPHRASRMITVGQWVVFLLGAPTVLAFSTLWHWQVMDHPYGHVASILAIGALLGGMGVVKRRIYPEVMHNKRRILVRAAISLAQLSLMHIAVIVSFLVWWIVDLKEGDWKGDSLKVAGIACACVIGILISEWGKLRLTQWRDAPNSG